VSVLEMCIWYGYDINKAKPICGKKHIASLKCHSTRKDCPDYISTEEFNRSRDRYIEAIRWARRKEIKI